MILPMIGRNVEGLSLDEMISIARDADPESWRGFKGLEKDTPVEFHRKHFFYGSLDEFWFNYDFQGRSGDLDIYLSNNYRNSIWNNHLAIRVIKGYLTLGFAGRLRESRSLHELKELCLYVDDCAKQNRKNLAKKESERRNMEIERMRGNFLGEGI